MMYMEYKRCVIIYLDHQILIFPNSVSILSFKCLVGVIAQYFIIAVSMKLMFGLIGECNSLIFSTRILIICFKLYLCFKQLLPKNVILCYCTYLASGSSSYPNIILVTSASSHTRQRVGHGSPQNPRQSCLHFNFFGHGL